MTTRSIADSGPRYVYCYDDWCNGGVLLAVQSAEVLLNAGMVL